ncbi:MAG TPA: glycosyl hydrolase family 18 protein [Puia sp.]|nr:glycosyl hydrolase family 18 protein [Puia sp.]
MKKKFVIGVWAFLAILTGCKKDEVARQAENDNFFPRIFDNRNVFLNPSSIINEGDTARFNGLSYSPSGQVAISWKVNGKQLSTDTAFNFKPDSGGDYTVTLEVTYRNQLTSRTSHVLVNPSKYTLKTYQAVSMGYLSADADGFSSLDWSSLSHVAYKSGQVIPDGSLDVTAGEQNGRINELVARAHINGVAVLLGISGRLSGIDGWALYESNDFGSVISDPVKMPVLVQAIKGYLASRRMDGVDIMMADVNSSVYTDNIHALGPFLGALRAALPLKAIITVTVAANWVHWEYPDLSAADWVNVHAFEDGIHVGPGAPRGQASDYDFMVSCAAIWRDDHLPAGKLVIGMPAFGLRYDAIDDNGNNAGWGSYSYVTYKDILKLDPQAFSKELVQSAYGIYYNGVPLVTQKAAYLKSNGFKGAYLWAYDFDSKGDSSLLGAISKALK